LVYKSWNNVRILFATVARVPMACLIGVSSMTRGYLEIAEKFSWAFIKNEDGDGDIIIGSRFREEIIGVSI
jgi:hypothetical protein